MLGLGIGDIAFECTQVGLPFPLIWLRLWMKENVTNGLLTENIRHSGLCHLVPRNIFAISTITK